MPSVLPVNHPKHSCEMKKKKQELVDLQRVELGSSEKPTLMAQHGCCCQCSSGVSNSNTPLAKN